MSGELRRLVATGSQTVGPFFHFGLAANEKLGCLVYPDTQGERIRLRVHLSDGRGDAVPDALVELWQADANGVYVQADAAAFEGATLSPRFSGFGRLPTGANGACVFETIRPGRVTVGSGTPQASHINVCVFMRGLLRPIYTRIYFAGDPALADDPVLALVPDARRATLLGRPVADVPGSWDFNIRLQGEWETVFFDL